MQKNKKNIEQVVKEEMPEFADEVAGLSVDSLNNRLAQCAKDAQAVQEAKEKDTDLEEAQASASGLLAPYRDAKKRIGLRSKYLIHLIKEKGGE